MVIVELIGGLGNQMFQYAIGRRMAENLQTSLRLDVLGFEKYPLRKYELHNFNILEEFASRDEVRAFSLSKPQKLLQSMKSWFGRQNPNRIKHIKESSFLFDPSVLQQQGNLYLTGYWQSEKYFRDITAILLKEFSSRNPLSARSESLRETMQMPGSVAIHIRRGDYVTNSQTNKVHGVLSLDYYRKAMDYIASRHDNVKFYLFSDDVAWLRENFSESHQMHIVEPVDAARSYEDMILMSSCNHNIIANSSFSWWAAWLNNNADKIVIAPQKWFNEADMDTSDLIPEKWTRLYDDACGSMTVNVPEAITIAICTRNRPDDLKRCVASIANASVLPSVKIEVAIIDDGNLADNFIPELATILPPGMQFQYYRKTVPGLLLSRLEALKIAANPIILFLDDDVEIDSQYIAILQATYSRFPDIVGLGGIDMLLKKPSILRRIFGYAFCLNSGDRARRSLSQFGDSMVYWNDAVECFETKFLSGCNMSFRKSALQQLRPVGWLQNYSLGEDVYLSYLACLHGRVFINPELKVWHHQAAVGRDRIEDVSYMEIVNSYHLMELSQAKDWHCLILLWSGLGKLISCAIRDNKTKRFCGYVKGLAKVAKLMTQKNQG